jgi:pimeloyl-ACP methyl ester carboxylesterase
MSVVALSSLRPRGQALAVALCLIGVLGLGRPAHAQALPEVFPKPQASTSDAYSDAFYAKPSRQALEALAPGTVLRVREIDPKAHFVFSMNARAWQLMFRSNDSKGQPVASITTVLVPPNAPSQDRVLVSYQVAYDALTLRCAPSQSLVRGRSLEQLQIDSALRQGWVLSIPDYEGLDSHWGAARNSGQGVLDAVRAAQAFAPLGLPGANTRVGLIGYSGGGLATAWAAQLAPDYAPELKLVGASAGGVPVDLANVARKVDGGFFSGLYLTMVVALTRAYPEIPVDHYINERGRAMIDKANEACVGQFLTGARETLLAFPFERMSDYVTVPDLLSEPPVRKVVEANRLGATAPKVPLHVYQARYDQVMPRDDVEQWVSKVCKAGTPVQYRNFISAHISGMAVGYPAARDFLADRFAGKPAPSTCSPDTRLVRN